MLNITMSEINNRRQVFNGIAMHVLEQHLRCQQEKTFEDAAIEVVSLLYEFADRREPVNFDDMLPWVIKIVNETNRAECLELPKIVSIWEE